MYEPRGQCTRRVLFWYTLGTPQIPTIMDYEFFIEVLKNLFRENVFYG